MGLTCPCLSPVLLGPYEVIYVRKVLKPQRISKSLLLHSTINYQQLFMVSHRVVSRLDSLQINAEIQFIQTLAKSTGLYDP